MAKKLKLYPPISKAFNSKNYILLDGLQNAIEVALALDQPLLLTGEPGTGKTKLAFKIADMLAVQNPSFQKDPLIFNTKTTSAARDLFYTYDALSHFQAANIKQTPVEAGKKAVKEVGLSPKDTAYHIELQALGKAIAQTNPGQISNKLFKTQLGKTGSSSVVLIDEIDKAPRDFSNDILNEIENYNFEIKEQSSQKITKGKDHQILVIMTSNSEKNLPDAFLRRCIFYHIPFPKKELLLEIINAQVSEEDRKKYQFTEQALSSIIDIFDEIRTASSRKKPATAELVSWIRILGLHQYMEKDSKMKKELMKQNLSILVKTQEDLKAVESLLDEAIKKESK